MTLAELNKQIKACSKCPLRETATQPVCGLGAVGSKYMLIGEAPGREEDKAGMPFVGLAGQRLNRLIGLAGIDINDCYLTNTVRCRPPKNRTPKKKERLSCQEFLEEEIHIIAPRYIITLGSTPLSLFSSSPIGQMHGSIFQHSTPEYSTSVIAQFHPAAALHQPRLWAVMLDDWEHLPEVVPHEFSIVQGMPPTDVTLALDTENDTDGSLGLWSVAFRGADNGIEVVPFYGTTKTAPIQNRVVMHNAKWDLRVLRANKMPEPANVVDTMIAAYCLGHGRQDITSKEAEGRMVGGLGLKYLARRHLGMEMQSWKETVGKEDPLEMAEYNAKDSVATLLLWEKFEPDLPQHFWDIDMPLLGTLMAIEDRGIAIDPKFLGTFAEHLEKALADIELPFNPFSTPQLRDYVYKTLGLQPWHFTDSGQPSVDSSVLETLDDPVIKKVLEYKSLYKEKGTYIDNYMERLTKDSRIHPEFKQCRTATGRLASAKPNLQNVPRDGDMRKLFVASPGCKLVCVDYSQLELRVFAAITGDPQMLEAFEKGHDIHQETSDYLQSKGFNIDRYGAKTINFLMLYGGTEWRISQEYHVTIDEAKALLLAYYKKFPYIRRYFEDTIDFANENKKVFNYYGRARRLDALYADDWRVRRQGEREAINMPIQATAADIVKLAMINLHQEHEAPMVLQVHDELLFEVDAAIAEDYAQWVKEHLGNLTEINGVKFPVDVGTGNNWVEAKA